MASLDKSGTGTLGPGRWLSGCRLAAIGRPSGRTWIQEPVTVFCAGRSFARNRVLSVVRVRVRHVEEETPCANFRTTARVHRRRYNGQLHQNDVWCQSPPSVIAIVIHHPVRTKSLRPFAQKKPEHPDDSLRPPFEGSVREADATSFQPHRTVPEAFLSLR